MRTGKVREREGRNIVPRREGEAARDRKFLLKQSYKTRKKKKLRQTLSSLTMTSRDCRGGGGSEKPKTKVLGNGKKK